MNFLQWRAKILSKIQWFWQERATLISDAWFSKTLAQISIMTHLIRQIKDIWLIINNK